MHIKNLARAVAAVIPARLRPAVILPVACLALGAAGFIAPAAASASVPAATYRLPVACNGDACFKLIGINAVFGSWADNYPFFGHFEIQTPEHTTYNSTPNQQWSVGEQWQRGVPKKNGQYCFHAWQLVGTNQYTSISSVCMNVTEIRP